jgi:type II secretory pathway component GspD/PulD (secretin)
VPILASIPYLGWLFRSNSESSIESQLVIFLRVNIMNLDQMNGASIRPDEISKEVTEEVDRLKENLKQPKPTLDSDLKKLIE